MNQWCLLWERSCRIVIVWVQRISIFFTTVKVSFSIKTSIKQLQKMCLCSETVKSVRVFPPSPPRLWTARFEVIENAAVTVVKKGTYPVCFTQAPNECQMWLKLLLFTYQVVPVFARRSLAARRGDSRPRSLWLVAAAVDTVFVTRPWWSMLWAVLFGFHSKTWL